MKVRSCNTQNELLDMPSGCLINMSCVPSGFLLAGLGRFEIVVDC